MSRQVTDHTAVSDVSTKRSDNERNVEVCIGSGTLTPTLTHSNSYINFTDSESNVSQLSFVSQMTGVYVCKDYALCTEEIFIEPDPPAIDIWILWCMQCQSKACTHII